MKKKPANHKSYRVKADELFMSQYRGLPCEVCGSAYKTVFHHLIPKGRSRALRYDKRNGCILCQKHHMFSNEMAPHSSNPLAVARFMKWFEETHPSRHKWIIENERIFRKYSYRQALENLKEGRVAWEI